MNGSASASASAQQYLRELQRVVGDSYATINGTQPKGTYNQSFAPGLFWLGQCALSPCLHSDGWCPMIYRQSGRRRLHEGTLLLQV